jgi:type IV secretion system protein VirB11
MLARELIGAEEESRARRRGELERVLGATITDALARPDVVEVLVNPDGRVWLDSLVDGMFDSGVGLAPHEAEDLCVTIASELGKTIDAEHPSLIGELPIDGSRVQGLFPPVVPAPAVAIRKKASRLIPLEEYVSRGILARNHYELLREAALERRNAVFVGGTGSGKTTFGNAFLGAIAELTPEDRLVILEDTYELQSASPNVVRLRKSEHRSLTTLLQDALRLRPDRIIVGECRDASAFDFLMALNTGHKGSFTTVHANSPREALSRLEMLVRLAQQPVIPTMIADAIDVIAFLQRSRGVFRVNELVRLVGVSASGNYELDHIDPLW